MTKMTEKQLILKLQALKQVKPNQEWAGLIKSQIFGPISQTLKPVFKKEAAQKLNLADLIYSLFQNPLKRKLAYSFAVLVFVMAGLGIVANVLQSRPGQISNNSNTQIAVVKSEVETFKAKSQNLIEIARHKPQDFALAVSEVKSAANELVQAIEKAPELAKEIAQESPRFPP